MSDELVITGLSTPEKSIEEFNDYLLEKISKVEKENIELKERLGKIEKVWKIIDKKQVAWGLIVRCESAEEYNKCTVEFSLTKTEFSLLKEMLRDA